MEGGGGGGRRGCSKTPPSAANGQVVPGGGVDPGESLYAAAARELLVRTSRRRGGRGEGPCLEWHLLTAQGVLQEETGLAVDGTAGAADAALQPLCIWESCYPATVAACVAAVGETLPVSSPSCPMFPCCALNCPWICRSGRQNLVHSFPCRVGHENPQSYFGCA